MGAKLSGGSSGGDAFPANSEMNVTPFVDVMLVLLIIFMIAAPLSTVSVPVELPPASAAPPKDKPQEPVFVTIEEDGTVYVMNDATTLPELADALRTKVAGNTEERIFLRADQNLAYRNVMEVMDLLQGAGFYRVGLVAEDKVDAGS